MFNSDKEMNDDIRFRAILEQKDIYLHACRSLQQLANKQEHEIAVLETYIEESGIPMPWKDQGIDILTWAKLQKPTR